ncbi:hypothetical protein [Emticicia soli]|uniref:Uncharacterized protein n=1 Tax=Emticicia soli TaxID=2027878 RepID=A0ABW5JEQ0_9BACT
MNEINKMIVAIYQSRQKSMKYSEGNARLFIAKLAFCVLVWIWLLPILNIFENNLHWIEISFNTPKTRIGYLPVLLAMYFILHYFTWKLNEVDKYSSDEANEQSIKKAKRLFITLLIIGFIFLVTIAKYNQGNPLSD